VKDEPRTLPKGKKSNTKGARVFVWMVVFLIAISAVLGFVRSTNALTKSKEAHEKIDDNQLSEESNEHQTAYDSPTFQLYAGEVVDNYINIPKEGDDRDEYMDTLKQYFVSDDFLPGIDFDGYRELVNKTYYGQEQREDHVVAQYKVSYDTTTIEEHEEKKKKKEIVEEEETESHEVLMNIPIRYDEGFAVVEPISFSNIPELKGEDQEQVVNPYKENGEDEVDMEKRNELKGWVEDFFSDYASNDIEDMAYKMDDPEGLNGLQEYKGVSDFHVYEKDDLYIVKVIVNFKEPEVEIEHQEPYTMEITKMNDNYYVKNLNKTLGGN